MCAAVDGCKLREGASHRQLALCLHSAHNAISLRASLPGIHTHMSGCIHRIDLSGCSALPESWLTELGHQAALTNLTLARMWHLTGTTCLPALLRPSPLTSSTTAITAAPPLSPPPLAWLDLSDTSFPLLSGDLAYPGLSTISSLHTLKLSGLVFSPHRCRLHGSSPCECTVSRVLRHVVFRALSLFQFCLSLLSCLPKTACSHLQPPKHLQEDCWALQNSNIVPDSQFLIRHMPLSF
jgi:hypothetical protein